MRLPLVVTCLLAASTWTFASPDALAASDNPKTAQKPFKAQARPQKHALPGTSAAAGLPASGGLGSRPHSMIAPSNDDCSTATAIAGSGPFAFDTTGASTNAQQSAACPDATLDVWYAWTATSTGAATMSTCGGGGTLTDTVIAAYAGSVCPLWGTELACNDDGCAPNLSQIVFAVSAGSTYMLQVGGYGGLFGSGSFTMNVTTTIPNDDCATPTAIAGAGTFAFDTTGATTSSQQSAACNAASLDLWYSWTAPASGACTMSLCASAGALTDSVIAAYAGGGCPVSGTELACNDDACGPYMSQITFAVTSGSSYLLQVGGYGTNTGDGTFDMNVTAGAANDDCASPILIGLGSFPYDNSLATTGAQGQTEPLCNLYAGTAIAADAWFQFTAPASGCTIVDNCGSVHDSKIAVYAGAGCPVPGTAIACNDDGCGRESIAVFTATAGQIYTVQLGSWPGGPAGIGTLNVSQPVPTVGDDDCSTPTLVAGLGAFPFDNSNATTSCDGQTESICRLYDTTSIATDVWFEWTAPSTGFAVMSTCLSGIDTKIAAYLGAGCPIPGSALACADDSCPNFSSTIVWSVTAGSVYTMQIGTYPIASAPGAGLFTLDVIPAPAPCEALDDGTTENIWSLGGASDNVWLNRFGALGTTTTIDSVDIMYGSMAYAGSSPPNGTPTDILVYADGPLQDGNPSDATLLVQVPSAVTNVDTDTYVTVVLPSPITVTGYFFAGAHESCAVGNWVAPTDENSLWLSRSWLFGNNTGGVANLANPGASAVPPTVLTGINSGAWGTFCVRVNCSFGPATYTCTPGDPGISLCPCSNPPTGSNRGCDNQQATGGASITGSGTASVSSSSLVFTTAGENASVGSVLIQGSAFNAGIAFGHGVRCAAGAVKRLYIKIASGGSITAPGVGDPSIPVRSAALAAPILPGDTRYYQVYYRDTTVLLPGCPVLANRFNVSNAAVVVWQP